MVKLIKGKKYTIGLSAFLLIFAGVLLSIAIDSSSETNPKGFSELFIQIVDPLSENMVNSNSNIDEFKSAIMYFADDSTGQLINQLEETIEYISKNETKTFEYSIYEKLKWYRKILEELVQMKYYAINWENISETEKIEARRIAELLIIQKNTEKGE